MSRLINLTDKRFGRLLVLSRRPNQGNSTMWFCSCICGNTTIVNGSSLKQSLTQSCGCLRLEAVKAATGTHGMVDTSEYDAWTNIKGRCYNKKNPKYKDYGERGITVSNEWRESFETFYYDMGPRPSTEHSIDRIENNESYSKENCRWATREEQGNNKRNNLLHDFDGQLMTLSRWCRELKLSYHTVYQRIYIYEMSFEEAIATPISGM